MFLSKRRYNNSKSKWKSLPHIIILLIVKLFLTKLLIFYTFFPLYKFNLFKNCKKICSTGHSHRSIRSVDKTDLMFLLGITRSGIISIASGLSLGNFALWMQQIAVVLWYGYVIYCLLWTINFSILPLVSTDQFSWIRAMLLSSKYRISMILNYKLPTVAASQPFGLIFYTRLKSWE